jgi:cholestenol delta-isomerase
MWAYAGDPYVRPEPLYYWFYYAIINSVWLVIPGLIVAHSWRSITGSIGNSPR